MSVIGKFIILYLIPLVTFAVSLGVYVHAYGKSPEDTYVNIGLLFTICSLVASSALAFNLAHKFLPGHSNYLGVVFSLIPCFLSIIVIILYLIVFFGVFNP
ncbi:hypothetical protein DFR28_1011056 [Arenicella xantha]|uniref:Uncharacterized protein n=1 Tax=Arenicella xantha TaxID=644221 RepID=A0A395JPY3_9GAMM|nr:hypothetical protein DFR28_1011056 [Arenicella xantha]